MEVEWCALNGSIGSLPMLSVTCTICIDALVTLVAVIVLIDML